MDLEKILSSIQKILNWIFQGQVPPWIIQAVGYVFAVGFVLLGVWGLLYVLGKIKKLWVDEFKPLFYDLEQKRRSLRRRRFADHIESEIRRLNNLEAWSDYRFAELEAEVEAEGNRRALRFFPWSSRTGRSLRREKSLSIALESTRDRLIILEGEPGSGKSVALRHVAQRLARKAGRSRATTAVIPIYVNLKELEKNESEPIDRNLIQTLVLRILNRVNDRDIEEFLEEEFDKGLKDGTWFFFFDSFDELPDVLSSTEADSTVRDYTEAISSFLHGLNRCRGVIASRHFRSPVSSGWPRFRILPLSEVRRFELIRKIGFSVQMQNDLIGEISNARQEIITMSGNPMFLGLLCEHIRNGRPFPLNSHTVFETYIQTRLARDEGRLERRFRLLVGDVRSVAETVAFCMAADSRLGLSPTRMNLVAAMERQHLTMPNNFEAILDALEYIKLARSETLAVVAESKTFTFSHRRFQEYFATCVVLKDPLRVSAVQLLTDGRWRETAVVMCQSQPLEVVEQLIYHASKLLSRSINALPPASEEPVDSHDEKCADGETNGEFLDFHLEPRLIHILGLLQDGFGARLSELPEKLRADAGVIIKFTSAHGALYEQKWALEVAGVIPVPLLLSLLRKAFSGQSAWLRDTAYRQTARLVDVPSDIALAIRRALVNLSVTGRLRREQHATFARLSRFDKSSHFLSVLRLLTWIPVLDSISITLVFVVLLNILAISNQRRVAGVIIFLGCGVVSYAFLRMPRFLADSLLHVPPSVEFVALNRVFLFIIVFSVLLTQARGRAVLWWVLFVVFALWAPMAWFHAIIGKFTHPIFWPVVPLFVVVRLPSLLRRIFASLAEDWRELILAFPILAVLLLPMLFLAPIALALGLNAWIEDKIRWVRWNQKRPSALTGIEFLRCLREFRFNQNRLQFIRVVRENDLIIALEESRSLLVGLVSKFEEHQHRRVQNPPENSTFKSELKEFTKMLLSMFFPDGRLSPRSAPVSEDEESIFSSYAIVDEINMLLEQVVAKIPLAR